MSDIYGRAKVWGINGIIAYGVAAAATQNMTGADFTNNWNEEPLINPATGEVIGNTATREAIEVTIDFTPIAATAGTGTFADARKACMLPAKYAVVTLSGFDEAPTPDFAFGTRSINGTYNYVGGGKITFSPEGDARLTLPLRRYVHTNAASVANLATLIA